MPAQFSGNWGATCIRKELHEDLCSYDASSSYMQALPNLHKCVHPFTHSHEAVNVAVIGAVRDITVLRVEYTSVANSAMVEGVSNRPACMYAPISENCCERMSGSPHFTLLTGESQLQVQEPTCRC